MGLVGGELSKCLGRESEVLVMGIWFIYKRVWECMWCMY